MRCPLCGAEFSETLTSCPNCGRMVEESDREKFVPKPNNPAMTYNDPAIHSNVKKYTPAPQQQTDAAMGYNGNPQKSSSAMGYNGTPQKSSPAMGYNGTPQQTGPAMGYNGTPQQTGPAMGYNGTPQQTGSAIGYNGIPSGNQQNNQRGGNRPPINKSTWIIIASAAAVVLLIVVIAVVIKTNKDSNRASTDPTEIGTEEPTESTTQAWHYSEPEENVEEIPFGETWTVDGQWAVKVLSVEKTDERNEYSSTDPKAVYVIKYAYTNFGYDNETNDGLFISFDSNIIDSAGLEGYPYPGHISYYPQQVPVGATCVCYTTIGVDNEGTFKVTIRKYDDENHSHTACFVLEPGKSSEEFFVSDKKWDDYPALKIGETWTVDGQWSLTINGVKEVQERNEYSELKPNAVYVIDYTYTNLGYENKYDSGLYITIDDIVVDSEGMMAYGYPGNIEKYPKETAVGQTCQAQECIGVDNAGDMKLTVVKYDGNGDKHKQSFVVEVK